MSEPPPLDYASGDYRDDSSANASAAIILGSVLYGAAVSIGGLPLHQFGCEMIVPTIALTTIPSVRAVRQERSLNTRASAALILDTLAMAPLWTGLLGQVAVFARDPGYPQSRFRAGLVEPAHIALVVVSMAMLAVAFVLAWRNDAAHTSRTHTP